MIKRKPVTHLDVGRVSKSASIDWLINRKVYSAINKTFYFFFKVKLGADFDCILPNADFSLHVTHCCTFYYLFIHYTKNTPNMKKRAHPTASPSNYSIASPCPIADLIVVCPYSALAPALYLPLV